MITQDPVRFGILKKSIQCYIAQAYPNRELIICCDGPPSYCTRLQAYVEILQRTDIYLHFVSEHLTLGEMRNWSVSVAGGDYVCPWDDDDLNHPRRLGTQLAHLRDHGNQASYLQDQLHYFYTANELYWVNWYPDVVPGSLMCRREVLIDNPYPSLARDEDGQLRDILRNSMEVAVLSGQGYLNLYSYHGSNTWSHDHHRSIHSSHDPEYLRGRENVVIQAIGHYDIPSPTLKYA
jgi:glycosyltransferase involved in cell wall biosynthesis